MNAQELIYLFVASLSALFPVMNPISNGFIINSFLAGTEGRQRKIYIKKIATNTFLIGLASLVIGHLILKIFGLAIPVIQVGGGILIAKAGMDWLSDSPAPEKSSDKKEETISHIDRNDTEKRLFYPISFPISIGPGTISVIFTLMATSTDTGTSIWKLAVNYSIIALVILILCSLLYVFVSQGNRLISKLGSSGNLIINKLIAFITFCIGLQIIFTGISKIFHINIL